MRRRQPILASSGKKKRRLGRGELRSETKTPQGDRELGARMEEKKGRLRNFRKREKGERGLRADPLYGKKQIHMWWKGGNRGE